MLLTRRHWLFGAAATLLVPARRIFIPAAVGEYGFSRAFPIPDCINWAWDDADISVRVAYSVRALYHGGAMKFVVDTPLDVNDIISVTLDGKNYIARVNEVMVGTVHSALAPGGVMITSTSDKTRLI